jgi:Na+/alanine symporter
MIACALVIPAALIFGALRGLPFLWQLLDCSFGIAGIIPLILAYRLVKPQITQQVALGYKH